MSIKPNPQTIFNDLLDRAMDVLGEIDVPDFELKRLERDSDKLASADRTGAYEIRAHVEATRGNFEAADDYYERAIKQSPDFVGVRMRYLVVLAVTDRVGKVREAYRRFENDLKHDPGAVQVLVPLLAAAGWVYTSQRLADSSRKMNVPVPNAFAGAEVAMFTDAQEEDVAEAVGFARSFLRKRGATPSTIEAMVVPYEDGTSALMFQFTLKRSPQETASLEWDLFAALEEHDLVVDRNRSVILALSSDPGSNASHLH